MYCGNMGAYNYSMMQQPSFLSSQFAPSSFNYPPKQNFEMPPSAFPTPSRTVPFRVSQPNLQLADRVSMLEKEASSFRSYEGERPITRGRPPK
ncbi:unnamed protein product [Sphagnum balticum]